MVEVSQGSLESLGNGKSPITFLQDLEGEQVRVVLGDSWVGVGDADDTPECLSAICTLASGFFRGAIESGTIKL